MTDAIAAPETVTPPAPTPGLTVQEIEALIERKAQEISDKRVSGLQSLYDKKLAEVQREAAKLRQQVLPGVEDDDDVSNSAEQARIQELERQLAIERASQKYAKAGPLYRKLLEFETPEEQIAFMEEFLTPPAAAPATPQPVAAPEAPPTPSVDPNSPASPPNGGILPTPDGGGFSSADDAERWLMQEQARWESGRR